MFLLPRSDIFKKITFVFSCLVLIGWRPSAIASKHLFVLQSWKLNSTERRKWTTTEHTDYRPSRLKPSPPQREPCCVAGCTLSTLAVIRAKASFLLSPFLVPVWQRTGIFSLNIPRTVKESPNPFSFAFISGNCFPLSSFGVTMEHSEKAEIHNDLLIILVSFMGRRGDSMCCRWGSWRGYEGSLCVSGVWHISGRNCKVHAKVC